MCTSTLTVQLLAELDGEQITVRLHPLLKLRAKVNVFKGALLRYRITLSFCSFTSNVL